MTSAAKTTQVLRTGAAGRSILAMATDGAVTSYITGLGFGGGGGGGAWGTITGTLSAQTDLQTALNLKSTIASPTFTGTPAAPTAASATNTTQIATTAFVRTEISSKADKTSTTEGIQVTSLIIWDGFQTHEIDIDHGGTDRLRFDQTEDLAYVSEVALKANLAEPAFTGAPTAPTAAPGTNTTQLSTTAFVTAAINALINSAPGVLDTLDELAAALGDDANFATTVTNALAGKLGLAGGQMTAAIRGTESTVTPSGASPSQTITLADSNQHTLACTSATGTIAVTLTRPAGSYSGRILVKVHASTATGITWAVDFGTLYWLGTQPTWTGLAVGKRLAVAVTSDGTDTYLAATEVNA